ncbi:TrkA C-terminal domain-containing protein [Rathayibacter sp. YIM 133350]|uniref:cation:proton antiporter regulatory subunit n=1 Tax=Rathayibacter sp. YIM 133350 TaxID=3131992 RepID=UPI00307E8431
MVDVRRVKLPGVGVLHTFITDDGGKVGVIAHRSGPSDLITFSDEASDAEKVSLRLTEDEAHTLAELLGGTQITETLTALDQIPGLSIDWFTVDYDDHIAGQPLGGPADSGVPGVTVVAVVRGEAAHPAPAPDFKAFPGDTLVVAGAPEKVAKAFAFFRSGSRAADASPGG